MKSKQYSALALAIALLLGITAYQDHLDKSNAAATDQLEKVEGSIEPLCTDESTPIRTLADLRKSRVQIEIPKSRKWASNIVAAKTGAGKTISDEFKKKFKAKFYVTNAVGTVCIFKASVRISGDWKDHLSIRNGSPIASMDVQLEQGNLAGIVDFKLLLPKTRGGDNEVIMSSLMRQMNILAPRTGYLDVTVNGTPIHYLFQENTEKELVESQNRREAPLYESDEAMFWQDRVGDNLPSDIDQRIITPKTTNSIWIGESDNRSAIAKRGVDILMSAYSSYWQTRYLYPELISNGNEELLKRNNEFISLMFAANAQHGLITHNRRFFLDPMRNGMEPVYYDGDAELIETTRVLLPANYSAHVGAQTLLPKVKAIDIADLTTQLQGLGANVDGGKVAEIVNDLANRLTQYTQSEVAEPAAPTWKANNFADLNSVDRRIVFAHDKDEAKVCTFDLSDCQETSFSIEDFGQLLGGKLFVDDIRYVYVGADQASYTAGQAPVQDPMTTAATYVLNPKTTMMVAGLADVVVNTNAKTVSVTATAPGSRIHIQNGELTGWTLNYTSAPGLEATDAKDRFDDRLLTGCVTIADTAIQDSTFNITNSLCEDGINFVRSSGELASLHIDGTLEDGLDMDFSELTIDDLHVANTGNDCLDLSAGHYVVKNMVLDNCGDKGMSIGETSDTKLEQGVINGVASIGIAVKDWSKLTVQSVAISNADVCVSLYRKKQEFGASSAEIQKLTCDPLVNVLQTNTHFRNRS